MGNNGIIVPIDMLTPLLDALHSAYNAYGDEPRVEELSMKKAIELLNLNNEYSESCSSPDLWDVLPLGDNCLLDDVIDGINVVLERFYRQKLLRKTIRCKYILMSPDLLIIIEELNHGTHHSVSSRQSRKL